MLFRHSKSHQIWRCYAIFIQRSFLFFVVLIFTWMYSCALSFVSKFLKLRHFIYEQLSQKHNDRKTWKKSQYFNFPKMIDTYKLARHIQHASEYFWWTVVWFHFHFDGMFGRIRLPSNRNELASAISKERKKTKTPRLIHLTFILFRWNWLIRYIYFSSVAVFILMNSLWIAIHHKWKTHLLHFNLCLYFTKSSYFYRNRTEQLWSSCSSFCFWWNRRIFTLQLYSICVTNGIYFESRDRDAIARATKWKLT